MSDLLTLCHDHAGAAGRALSYLDLVLKNQIELSVDNRIWLKDVKKAIKEMNSAVDHYYDRASKYSQE